MRLVNCDQALVDRAHLASSPSEVRHESSLAGEALCS
jgi:hypothetical protein